MTQDKKKLPVYLVFENVARLIYTKGVGRGMSMLINQISDARADIVFFGNISFCLLSSLAGLGYGLDISWHRTGLEDG